MHPYALAMQPGQVPPTDADIDAAFAKGLRTSGAGSSPAASKVTMAGTARRAARVWTTTPAASATAV